MSLQKKIDFAVVFKVENANPNGDPLGGNRPRADFEELGEVSDVCLKRKIRNRLLDSGESIFVQSDDYKNDDAKSLKDRADKVEALKKEKDKEKYASIACKTWFDVRAFGQIFAFKGKKEDSGSGVSIGIRGPVSIQTAFSKEPVEIISTQITKSVNAESTETGKKSSDTMGTKHRVKHAVYVFYGAMNPQLAEKTSFSDDDAQKIKAVLPRLFENDESSARPAGSMEILKVIWWQHNSKLGQYSSAKVHKSLEVDNNGEIKISELKDLKPEIIEGY
ncbi:type I-C CRISPR-associated protein Cas7/Csd2 [Endomicrobium proavitum]|uniref:CRISPR-associated protein cas7/csd2, subtype I-c/dvulg n=1 Tax=Endomicrobium proavitum TaxID=1408281 RepID=A0A0G3WJK2_9BACT|nr:type I-C CRISPR-associated protein Cas7/Csd2 [Endomicrobium proavitum]AKL98463.1 CRISPR-associated protein cas7/csd2, subtype I-c/dvulg [Endomicrobium proavitum]